MKLNDILYQIPANDTAWRSTAINNAADVYYIDKHAVSLSIG